jgi:hypothetical protein
VREVVVARGEVHGARESDDFLFFYGEKRREKAQRFSFLLSPFSILQLIPKTAHFIPKIRFPRI